MDAAPKEKYDNNAPVAAAYKWRAAALGTYRHNQLQGIEARKQTRKRSIGTPVPSNSATASIVIIATRNLLVLLLLLLLLLLLVPLVFAVPGRLSSGLSQISVSGSLSVCLSGRLRQVNKDFSSTSGRISASMNPLGKGIRAVPGRLSSGLAQISVSRSLSVCLSVCLSGRLRQANKYFSPTSGRISVSMNPLGKEIRDLSLVVFVKRSKTSLLPADESQPRWIRLEIKSAMHQPFITSKVSTTVSMVRRQQQVLPQFAIHLYNER